MGKKQHSKDQLYITTTEWGRDWGGKKSTTHIPYKTLPFDCCAISFRPFENPMCTPDGIVFDLLNIVPYLKKFKRHPVTGAPLAASDLIKLHFHKNPEGKYACPVLYKTFNQHSHIVAIKATGNVYSHEAVKELNLKAGNLRDLIDDTPFKRDEVITIQDPTDGTRREIERFSHVCENLTAKTAKDESGVRHNEATARIMGQIKAKEPAAASASGVVKAGGVVAGAAEGLAGFSAGASSAGSGAVKPRWLQTTGQASASFTSTSLAPQTVNEIAALSEDELRRQRHAFLAKQKKKGYAQLQLTHGNVNLELHADVAPLAVESFVRHCESGYYRGVAFHRLIRNFMLQGGDPTGTGSGGESAWGKPFKDEISGKYRHDGRGVLSMANSGPDCNGSQFFITFKSAPHIDGKHTVFGRVVGGLDTLARAEKVPTDAEDRPKETISIVNALVLVDPFEGLDAAMAAEQAKLDDPAAAAAAEAAKRKAEDSQAWYTTPTVQQAPLRPGVGKYIAAHHFDAKPSAATSAAVAAAVEEAPPAKKVKKAAGGFGDFSGW